MKAALIYSIAVWGTVKKESVYVCMARSQAEEALLFLPCICFDFADNCRYDTMDFLGLQKVMLPKKAA